MGISLRDAIHAKGPMVGFGPVGGLPIRRGDDAIVVIKAASELSEVRLTFEYLEGAPALRLQGDDVIETEDLPIFGVKLRIQHPIGRRRDDTAQFAVVAIPVALPRSFPSSEHSF